MIILNESSHFVCYSHNIRKSKSICNKDSLNSHNQKFLNIYIISECDRALKTLNLHKNSNIHRTFLHPLNLIQNNRIIYWIVSLIFSKLVVILLNPLKK